MAKLKQHETPEGFARLWRVGGAPWETPYAQRVGYALGYEVDENGRDLVRLRFADGPDGPDEALFTPWELFPVDTAEGGRPGRAAVSARYKQLQERRRQERRQRHRSGSASLIGQ